MHFDDHESQVPVSSSPLQFQHFTMPVHEKRDTSGLNAGTQKPSGSQVAPLFTGEERWEHQRSTARQVSMPGVQGEALIGDERRDQIYRVQSEVYPPDQSSPSGWYQSDVTAPLPRQASSSWTNARTAPTLPQIGSPNRYRAGGGASALKIQLKPVYQNGYPGQVISFDVAIPGTPYPARMAQVPNLAVPQVQQYYGAAAIQQGSWNQHNILLDASNSAAKKRSLLLELPHLIGYMVGMMAIFGLYLIIPMMILLNATLPDSWNKLMIAASILVIGEIAICMILVKTIPRRKSKHKHKTHRRDALARPYQRT